MNANQQSQPLLQVQDLQVAIGERTVLQSVSLDVQPGSVVVLMGANGSGKSTLGLTLAGHPRYRVTAGSVRFGDADLLAMNVEQRARAGLFLSFQAPPEIPGVKNNLFIRTAVNAVRESRGEAPLDAFDFLGEARGAAKRLGLPDAMLGRPVNDGFSGGERKRNELLQLSLLRPRRLTAIASPGAQAPSPRKALAACGGSCMTNRSVTGWPPRWAWRSAAARPG